MSQEILGIAGKNRKENRKYEKEMKRKREIL
jgi:hypothetical protein